MINDPQATFRVVDAVRRVAPQAAVVIRTRYLADQDRLLALGGSRVVAEEVEGGIEVLAHVLRELDVPRNVIEAEIHGAREATQASVRSMTIPRNRWAGGAPLSALKVESVLVVEGSPGASRSLREIDLRAKTGALLVAIQRGESLLSHPRADEALAPGDVAYLIGEADSVQAAVELLGRVESSDDDG
jgi:CPA2 family monovalent cation:H+ antiporter-2